MRLSSLLSRPGQYRSLWLLLVLAAPVAAALELNWPEAWYNPQPLAEDLLLPLPCGGALILRAVPTPAYDADYAVAGGFGVASGAPYLLIGKYEVTQRQAQAIQAAAAQQPCPQAEEDRAAGRQPVLCDWVEAVALADQYSRWLMTQAKTLPLCTPETRLCLPREDDVLAHVRLPTDREWEYAARGGLAVDAEDFGAPRYPMPAGLKAHAWYAANAGGRIHPIGEKAANPLGLHDLYGNVAEWSQELDTDPDGGGTANLALGGQAATPEGDLAANRRWHYPFYGQDPAHRTGLRLVASVPIYTTTAKVREARARRAGPPSSTPEIPPPPPIQSFYGKLRVEADAPAEVLLDGQVIGKVAPGAPFKKEDLAVGTRYLALRAEGYTTESVEQTLRTNRWTAFQGEIAQVLDDRAWQQARAADDATGYRAYLHHCQKRKCRYQSEAQERLKRSR